MNERTFVMFCIISVLFSGTLDTLTTLLCARVPNIYETNPVVRKWIEEHNTTAFIFKCLVPVPFFVSFYILWKCCEKYKAVCKAMTLCQRFIEIYVIVYAVFFIFVVVNNLVLFLLYS